MTSSVWVALVAVAAAVSAGSSSSSSSSWFSRSSTSDRGRIYVAGLIPLTSDDTRPTDDDTSAPDVLDAILMAVSHVNRDRRILPNHDLHLVWNDTKVHRDT